jgi:hypothetical protein
MAAAMQRIAAILRAATGLRSLRDGSDIPIPEVWDATGTGPLACGETYIISAHPRTVVRLSFQVRRLFDYIYVIRRCYAESITPTGETPYTKAISVKTHTSLLVFSSVFGVVATVAELDNAPISTP